MIDLTLSFTQASVYEFPGADAACHEFQKLIDVYDKLIKIATGLENHEITPLATQGLLNIHPCGLRKVVERVESDFFEKFYKPTYKPLIETRWLRAWKSLTKCAAVSETGK